MMFRLDKFRPDRIVVRIGWLECVVRFERSTARSLDPDEAARQEMMDRMRSRT